MNDAMNALFGALPMPGSGNDTPPPETVLPSLDPAGVAWDDDSWADVEPPAEEDLAAYGPDEETSAPSAADAAAVAPTWEERQAEVSALVARAQANAAAARARAGVDGSAAG
ncbi:Hypothetical protein AAM4_0543, partial [Actinomyces succiniciruminis]